MRYFNGKKGIHAKKKSFLFFFFVFLFFLPDVD